MRIILEKLSIVNHFLNSVTKKKKKIRRTQIVYSYLEESGRIEDRRAVDKI